MKPINELSNKYSGATERINRLLNYHYDQVMREIEQELSYIPENDKIWLLTYFTEHMENWANFGTIDFTQWD